MEAFNQIMDAYTAFVVNNGVFMVVFAVVLGFGLLYLLTRDTQKGLDRIIKENDPVELLQNQLPSLDDKALIGNYQLVLTEEFFSDKPLILSLYQSELEFRGLSYDL